MGLQIPYPFFAFTQNSIPHRGKNCRRMNRITTNIVSHFGGIKSHGLGVIAYSSFARSICSSTRNTNQARTRRNIDNAAAMRFHKAKSIFAPKKYPVGIHCMNTMPIL